LERSYFLNDTYYQSADFARFFFQIIGNGVSSTDDLIVEAKQNMTVMLGPGNVFANGYRYENTATKDLTHDTAHTEKDRLDRIVICFDNTPGEEDFYSYVKKGTPADNPVPPALTRNDYIFEMSVNRVLIKAGKSFIEQDQITDERTDKSVCGYILLHNIYRGLQINELGMATMTNQSFVDVYTENISDVYLRHRDSDSDILDVPLENIKIDKQNEINGNKFIPKADGVYNVWLQIRTNESDLRSLDIDKADVQIANNINGSRPGLPLFARVFNGYQDNIWTGNQIIELNKGDELKFQAWLQHFTDTPDIPVRDIRCRIAKIS